MMRTRLLAVATLTTVLLAGPVVARADTAANSFAKGESLLAKGDFAGALQSYAAAARADRDNQDYLQHYAMLRRVVEMRGRLEAEQSPERWDYLAKALRAFYLSERIYPELLELDQDVHARLSSAESAALLAETQLALGKNAEAAQTLASLERSKATPITQAIQGIALVRTGKADEAKQIAKDLQVPADAGPRMAYAAARFYAVIGDSAKAIQWLQTCFEGTLPSMVDGYKSHAKGCADFASLAGSPEFTRVLETISKIPESRCSGGSSCANCPMSGKCPKSQAKQ
jgi:tetratricopeptide (TPR) repeat protein